MWSPSNFIKLNFYFIHVARSDPGSRRILFVAAPTQIPTTSSSIVSLSATPATISTPRGGRSGIPKPTTGLDTETPLSEDTRKWVNSATKTPTTARPEQSSIRTRNLGTEVGVGRLPCTQGSAPLTTDCLRNKKALTPTALVKKRSAIGIGFINPCKYLVTLAQYSF